MYPLGVVGVGRGSRCLLVCADRSGKTIQGKYCNKFTTLLHCRLNMASSASSGLNEAILKIANSVIRLFVSNLLKSLRVNLHYTLITRFAICCAFG